MRILVLEDDPKLGESFVRRLTSDGYAVDLVRNLSDAQRQFSEVDYDLLVVDRRVPGGDGLELAEEEKARENRTPVLIVSSLTTEEERVEGLERGAADYMAKPISLRELSLRASKLMVRDALNSGGRLRVGRVSIDPERRRAFIDEDPVDLSRTQFGILEYLFLKGDRPVSAEELLEHVWDRHADPFSGAVPPQMSRLRAEFAGVLEFRNIREVGYQVLPVESGDDTAAARRDDEP